MRRRGPRLLPGIFDAYVGREYLFSFLVCFLFFFVVFFVNQLLLMAEDILSKRAPLRDVLLLLLFATPSLIAMSVPFASLVGALMATGRLASDNELLIFQASGIRPRRVFIPFLLIGCLLSLLSFAVNDIFLPLGTLEFGKVYRKLLVSSPALELKPWSSRRYKDITVVTGDVTGTSIHNLLIFDRSDEGRARVISARSARLETLPDSAEIVLLLDSVWTQTLKEGETGRFEYSSCSTMEYRIALQEGDAGRNSISPKEMSSTDLGRSIAAKAADFGKRREGLAGELERERAALTDDYAAAVADSSAWESAASLVKAPLAQVTSKLATTLEDRSLDLYRLEYYKKYSIPAGAAVFVLLSFPIGARARKSGRSVGFGLGLLIAVIYWALLLGGQTLGNRLGVSPFWAMWMPDVIVAVFGIIAWLTLRRTR